MFDRSRIRKSKMKNNKTSKVFKSSKPSDKIWGVYGKVLNPNTNTYVRIGSPASMKAINDLEHNAEWKKRVNYIISHHPGFGKKLETYLSKKTKN